MKDENKYNRFEELKLVVKRGNEYLIYEIDKSRGLERKTRLLIHGDNEDIPVALRNKVETPSQIITPIGYKLKFPVKV